MAAAASFVVQTRSAARAAREFAVACSRVQRPSGALVFTSGALAEDGATPRQLARSGRFLGSSDWNAWDEAFVVPKDCPVQRLRLELANPRGDADTPGNVAARLSGTAWFDDFLIRGLD